MYLLVDIILFFLIAMSTEFCAHFAMCSVVHVKEHEAKEVCIQTESYMKKKMSVQNFWKHCPMGSLVRKNMEPSNSDIKK